MRSIQKRVVVSVMFCGAVCLLAWASFLGYDIFRGWQKSEGTAPSTGTLLVLGDRLHEGKVEGHFRQRLDRAVTLSRIFDPNYILISGGGSPSEASAGKHYLIEQGISAEQIVTEDQSCSTVENVAKSARIIQSRPVDGPVTLVTNGFHLRRALHLAQENGLQVQGVPAEDNIPPLTQVWPGFVREIVATMLHSVWGSPSSC